MWRYRSNHLGGRACMPPRPLSHHSLFTINTDGISRWTTWRIATLPAGVGGGAEGAQGLQLKTRGSICCSVSCKAWQVGGGICCSAHKVNALMAPMRSRHLIEDERGYNSLAYRMRWRGEIFCSAL